MKKIIFSAIVVLILFAVDSKAQTGIGLGPLVGYHKAGDADDGRIMAGLALRLRLSPALGIEGSINYRQQNFADDAIKVRSWPLLITGMFYPIPMVYGALGAGWHNTTIDYANITNNNETIDLGEHTSQEFGWHLGAGLEFNFGSGTSLYSDIRYVFLNYEIEDLATQAINELDDLNANFYMINVGILFGL